MSAASQSTPGNLKSTSKTSLADMLMAAMTAAPQTSPKAPDPSAPACANPAVAQCSDAYARALNKALSEGRSNFTAKDEAEHAYRSAMPPLSGPENIRNFIACIAHGMLLEAIKNTDATRLLYAAQVARGALDKPSRAPGRPISN